MSDLQDLLRTLEKIDTDAERHSSELVAHARRLGMAAASAAAAARQSARADGVGAAVALQAAQHAVVQAAQLLQQVASAGRRFQARHAPGGGAATPPGQPETAADVVLTAADAAALGDYTGQGYRAMNDALRGKTAMTSDADTRAAAVSAALAKLPDRPGPAFRGTQLTPEQIAGYAPGQLHHEDGFTSTTSDPASAFPGNALFLVFSKHGKDVAAFSPHPESEVLFDKGTDFYVTSNFYDPHVGKQVIIMMEV
ncbi:ADP-ribosyltransferase [Microbacterium sp. LWO12-1.2]|uniref:ADP-ribosyltransferase n=1 Tax=Microbacterium sp. LWO12-1.2 TaxID=3135261 RepID=UPI003425118E